VVNAVKRQSGRMVTIVTIRQLSDKNLQGFALHKRGKEKERRMRELNKVSAQSQPAAPADSAVHQVLRQQAGSMELDVK
jgi:hypothetical protein